MLRHLLPSRIETQLMSLLAVSFAALLGILTFLETLDQDDLVDWARSDYSVGRFSRIIPVIPRLKPGEEHGFIDNISRCHEGYSLTQRPGRMERHSAETDAIAVRLSRALGLEQEKVVSGFVTLTRDDFSFGDCKIGEINFPVEGIVISVRLGKDQWLNAEVHPHKWHFTPTVTAWLVRSTAVFFLVGIIAFLFVRRIGRPLNALTTAAQAFGRELKVAEVDEAGPPDVKRAIQSFNAMQAKVANEVKKRTITLAAIGHDIRTPLTALRLKSELISDEAVRTDLLASVAKMEQVTQSALEYLQGDARGEKKKSTDVSSLVESECSDFIEAEANVAFSCAHNVFLSCRPDALSRAVHNLIENAVKYAGHAKVTVYADEENVVISVADHGPGIPPKLHATALEPFQRISTARESTTGGFGLGLASVKAVVEGHDGELRLSENTPHGLIANIILPINQSIH